MYNEFEQDLILACKCWYGDNGIDKVIQDAIGYDRDQYVSIHSKYHFISQLYIKLIENKHLMLYNLIEHFKPSRIDAYSMYEKMCSEIMNLKIKNDSGLVIVELHEPNEKYKED